MLVKMRLPLLLASIVTLALLATPARAGDDTTWREVRTRHFIVRSNVDQEALVRFVENMERFRALMITLTSLDPEADVSTPLLVYAFSNSREYWIALGARGTLGFYKYDLDGPRAFLSLETPKESWRPSGLQVLYHEYTHHMMYQTSKLQYPRWYSEGFADYVSTIRFDGDSALVGLPPAHRLLSLKSQRWLSMDRILDARGKYLSSTRNGVPDVLLQYSQGWLLTHFFYSKPELAHSLRQYLVSLNASAEDASVLFTQIFGLSVPDLEAQLKAYWDAKALSYFSVKTTAMQALPATSTRVMEPAESRIQRIEALFLADTGDIERPRYRNAFNDALESGIRPVDMHTYLALNALRGSNVERARLEVEAFVGLAPESPRAAYLQAMLLKMQLRKVTTPAPESLEAIRQLLRTSILRDSRYAAAWFELGSTYSEYPGSVIAAEALTALETARALVEGNFDVELAYTHLLTRLGRFDEAEASLATLIAWSTDRDTDIELEKEKEAVAKARSRSH